MSEQIADDGLKILVGWNMTDGHALEQEHEAKKRCIEAIKAVLARYAAGEIGQEQATAEIEAITHGK